MSWGARFHSAARMEREAAQLWPRVWLFVGPPPAPGQWLGFEHGRQNAVLSRDEDGVLRAFFGACPHRGTRLCGAGELQAELRCPYHGWSFAPDGRALRGEAPLRPMAVQERWGFAWVSPGGADPALFDPLEPLIAPYGLEGWGVSSRLSVPLRCDWKLSVEVHLEGLHLPTLHPEIADRVDWRGAAPSVIGRHGLMRVPPLDPRIGPNTLVQVFPNVQFNLHPQQALVFRHRPDPELPGRCVFDQLALSPGPRPPPPAEVVGPDDPRIGPVTAADLRLAERLAEGLRGGGLLRPRWTAAEALVCAFHEAVDAALEEP